jgi:DNA modification methylase
VGKAAARLGRRFVLIEINPRYVHIMSEEAKQWLGQAAKDVLTINCPSIDVSDMLF